MTIAYPAGDFARQPMQFDAMWRRHAAVLAGAWALLLLIFARDVVQVGNIYWTNATFGHCLFMVPVIGWLVWQRRYELAQVAPSGWWPGLALVGAGGLAWLVGEAAAVALFRHAGLILMLQGAVVTVLGPNVARALLFPLTYMFFLIPFGEGLEAPLQSLTVEMVMPLLHLFGVPAEVDGVLITTPNGYFEVAEACSGARFVIAMLAFGTLAANVCFVSWKRRIGFMAAALVLPLIANGIRAFGTIYVAWWTSVEAATGMDHIVYGWVFFAVVTAAVLAIGWPWFDRDPDAPWFDPAKLKAPVTRRLDAPVAALLVLVAASVFPAWTGLVASQAKPLPSLIDLPRVPGWTRAPLSNTAPWVPSYGSADHFLFGRYTDAQGRNVDLAVALYETQREGKELVGYGLGPIGPEDKNWVRIEDVAPVAGGHAIRMAGPGRVERLTVTWYRVGTALTGSERDVKLQTLKARLLGGPQRGAALLVSAEGNEAQARAAIESFVRSAGPLDAMADRISGTR